MTRDLFALSPVHTSNEVEATESNASIRTTCSTKSNVASTLLLFGNNVERIFREMSSFRQSRNKLNVLNLFRLCRKDEISFDIDAKNGNNVEETFDFVERIVRLTTAEQHFNWHRASRGLSATAEPLVKIILSLRDLTVNLYIYNEVVVKVPTALYTRPYTLWIYYFGIILRPFDSQKPNDQLFAQSCIGLYWWLVITTQQCSPSHASTWRHYQFMEASR